MVKRRQILDVLTRSRLLDLARTFEIDGLRGRPKAEIIASLAKSRAVTTEALLDMPKRAELKAICRAVGLDDGGRSKAEIVARLLGRAAPGESTPAPKARASNAPSPAPEARRGRRHNGGSGAMTDTTSSGATIGYEADLWRMADALRGGMDAAEYKHVVLGLIFLKYISDAFEELHAKLESESAEGADPEDPDEYRGADPPVFWVPPEARWPHLKAQARQATIGQLVDDAMEGIERDNPALKGVLPKDYARPALDKQRLGQLIDLVSNIRIPCPHLHLFREGFGDKWAVQIPADRFPRTLDLWGTLADFLKFCNVTQPPYIDRGLFT